MSQRRAKIVCTLGPATASEEKIKAILEAGADVIRLNFSHGLIEEHGRAIRLIRRLSDKPILQDLQGPKIRIGALQEPQYRLRKGNPFTLVSQRMTGNAEGAATNYPRLCHEVFPGDTIFLNDGLIALSVLKIANQKIHCQVTTGGLLEPYKGVSVPGRALAIPVLTQKDRHCLTFGLDQGVDFVALSMVQRACDVLSVRKIINKAKSQAEIIAKLEREVAICNLDEILKVADGVMVARGDLGVDMPPEQVPLIQKEIIRRANRAHVPVITATQMLESMIANARPTRAEASDVANAVLDGTDALMLSAETATGAHPIEAVRMMNRIIVEAEKQTPALDHAITPGLSCSEAISKAACLLAREMNAKAIVTSTLSGKAALRLSKYRPPVPIIAVTPSPAVCRRMSLYWGVTAHQIPRVASGDDIFKEMMKTVCEKRVAKKGDLVVLVAQSPKLPGTPTDLIKIYPIPG